MLKRSVVVSFFGRKEYLKEFRRELNKKRPSLMFLYGRRRVGKTRLIEEAAKDQLMIHFQAKQVTEGDNIKRFKKCIRECLSLGEDPLLADLQGWSALFIYMERVAQEKGEQVTVVFDEFPYLCEANKAIPSIFQEIWDKIDHENKPVNLILCGSQIAFMEELLSQKNPLHGRQTYKLKLPPLTLQQAKNFFPGWAPEDILTVYGIFGGIPHYLNLCDSSLDLKENLFELVLSPASPLLEEPMNLLRSELSKIHRYSSLLLAIARGNTEWGKILNQIEDLKSEDMGYYMERLKELHLIRVEAPLHVKKRKKRRNKRYYLEDPFFNFWYRFIFPNEEIIRSGQGRTINTDVIEPELSNYMGGMFELICQQFMTRRGKSIINSPARETGKIWTGDYDIDVVGTSLKGEEFYGECKWWDSAVGTNVLKTLEENIEKTSYSTGSAHKHRLLFSKSGFTQELNKLKKTDRKLHLLTPKNLVE
jgi:hypothetical protein